MHHALDRTPARTPGLHYSRTTPRTALPTDVRPLYALYIIIITTMI